MALPRLRPLGLGLISAAAALDVTATWLLASAMGPANDLYPRWYGTRAWLLTGVSPYAPAVDDGIRAAMGHAPGEALGGFVFGFVYPGYVAPLLAPLALLPFQAAATIWLLLAQVSVVGGSLLVSRIDGDEKRAAPISSAAWMAGLAILFPAGLYNLAFGQFAALVFLALACGCWLTTRRHGTLGGAALALAWVKPSLALVPLAAVAAHQVAERQWRVLASFLGASAVLAGVSILLLPNWPVEFLSSTQRYAQVASATSAAWLLVSLLLPAAGAGARLAATVAVSGVVLGGCLLTLRSSQRRLVDVLSVGALAGAWIVPPLYEWNSVLLLVPLIVTLRPASNSRRVALCGAVCVATLPVLLRWPYGSRLLWPSVALLAWSAAPLFRRYRGSQKVIRVDGSLPTVPLAP